MADQTAQGNGETQGNGGGSGPAAGAAEDKPRLRVKSQYVRDLSFESPNGPEFTLRNLPESPKMDVTVDVRANRHSGDLYLSELKISAEARQEDKVAFLVEIVYAGIFSFENVPEDKLQPVLLIECPRILFPFARRILADATRDGGFPPLMLDPIDFAALYQQQMGRKLRAHQSS